MISTEQKAHPTTHHNIEPQSTNVLSKVYLMLQDISISTTTATFFTQKSKNMNRFNTSNIQPQ
jgi:hypothetical protein